MALSPFSLPVAVYFESPVGRELTFALASGLASGSGLAISAGGVISGRVASSAATATATTPSTYYQKRTVKIKVHRKSKNK